MDLTNLGKIFCVEQRAETLVAELRGRIDKLEQSHPGGAEPARVFVYDSGTDQPFTSGKYASPHDIIAAAGGRNVLDTVEKGSTTVGWEPVVAADPEVIIIIDYADQPAADKQAFLESHPAMRSVPAVQQDRYFVVRGVLRGSGQRTTQRHGSGAVRRLPALDRPVSAVAEPLSSTTTQGRAEVHEHITDACQS